MYNGREYHMAESLTLIPVKQDGSSAIFMIRPSGTSQLIGVPAIQTGPAGMHAELESEIDLILLEHDDETPDSEWWEPVVPPGPTTPAKYKLHRIAHKAPPGEDGDTVLNPSDFVNALPGRVPAVNAAGNAFELVAQPFGDRFLPAEVYNSGTDDSNTTLTTIAVDPQDTDCRIEAVGHTIVTGSNCVVDFVARMGNENNGNAIAICHGVGGVERLQFTAMPPRGSADGFDRLPKGQATQVHIRTEKRSGAGTYTTTEATTRVGVWVRPIQ